MQSHKPMRDIKNRTDLYILVKQFYIKLFDDTLLKPFFADIDTDDKLESHLQILVNFWDQQLFYKGTYNRNALQPHLTRHQKLPFKPEHFKQWLKLFSQTIDENFDGEKANQAKIKAQSIATVIQIKISQL